jgi:hypothetical protein
MKNVKKNISTLKIEELKLNCTKRKFFENKNQADIILKKLMKKKPS